MLEKLKTSFAGRFFAFVLILILGAIFKNGIFHNIAWIFYGLSAILFPCWPKAGDHADHEKMMLGCRIAGVLAIVVGLVTRFGV